MADTTEGMNHGNVGLQTIDRLLFKLSDISERRIDNYRFYNPNGEIC